MSKNFVEVIQNNSSYITGIFSVGVVHTPNGVILVDSGSDEQSAKNVAEALQAKNYTPSAIINTHCHPDHCGGNYFFQKKFPALKVYATYNEKLFIEDPALAPRCFCGQAAPFAGLQNKHIAPQKPSLVTDVVPYEESIISVDGTSLKIVPLPGHTPGSIGIITADNVLYSGDAVFGQQTFEKHPVLLYTDIEATLASFKKLASLNVNACVLYHGGVSYELAQLAAQHEARILDIKEAILTFIKKQKTSLDVLTQYVMQTYKVPNTLIAFTLTQTTVRAYVTQLEKEKAVEIKVEDGLLTISSL